jgi:quinol monooxygenase YgiN
MGDMNRRDMLLCAPSLLVLSACDTTPSRSAPMYGLIGKMIAAEGKRDELLAIMSQEVTAMPGCLSYVIAKDSKDPNAVWISEVWDNEASHKASLSLPAVRNTIAKAKPLIAGFGDYFTTEPVGGIGLRKP